MPERSNCTCEQLRSSMFLFVCCRAAQKFSISSKRRKKKECLEPDPTAPPAPMFPTNFRSVLQHSPPPVPPCLTRSVTRPQAAPYGAGKVCRVY